MAFRHVPEVLLAVVAALALLATVLPRTVSSFTGATGSSGNTVSAAADWTAPAIGAAEVVATSAATAGALTPGSEFRVYANVADSGAPPSGVGSVTASVGNIATTPTATLTAGSYTAAGVAYGFRSEALTAKSSLGSGTYAFSVAATDAAHNGPATRSGSAQVDATPFAPIAFTTADGGGNTGKAETGDSVSFEYTKAPLRTSILGGWSGGTARVTVAVVDGKDYGLDKDEDLVGILDSSGSLTGLGYVVLNGDYVSSDKLLTFSNSAMVLTGATVTVTLGSLSGSGAHDENKDRSPDWHPSDQATDANGTRSPTGVVSMPASRQF